MAVDYDKLNFYTGANYMKRSDKSGAASVTCTSALDGGPVHDVVHGLGYVPQYLVFAELDNDGIIWYGGERVWEGTESTSGNIDNVPPIISSWVTEDKISFRPALYTGQRTVYYLIYLDYSGR